MMPDNLKIVCKSERSLNEMQSLGLLSEMPVNSNIIWKSEVLLNEMAVSLNIVWNCEILSTEMATCM